MTKSIRLGLTSKWLLVVHLCACPLYLGNHREAVAEPLEMVY